MNQTGELEKKALAGTFTILRRWIQKYIPTSTKQPGELLGSKFPPYGINKRLEDLRRKTARIRGYHNHIHNSSEVVPEQSYSESD